MMSLLPGSQGSEKDACVSLQLEQEVKIFTAQRWRWGPSVCLPLEPPCCGLLCFCDHIISPEVTPQSPLVLEVCFFLLLLQDSLLVFLSVHNIRPHVVEKCCTKGLLNCSRQRSPETNLGCLSDPASSSNPERFAWRWFLNNSPACVLQWWIYLSEQPLHVWLTNSRCLLTEDQMYML